MSTDNPGSHRARPHITQALSREKHLARPRVGHMSPLRTAAPCGRPAHRLGDCAGRSPGLQVITSRPAFPVSQWLMRTKGSPLTVAGAATVTAQRVEQDNMSSRTISNRLVFPLASPARPGEPARGQHSAIGRKGQDWATRTRPDRRVNSAACCSAATEYDRRPWHSVPACGLWGHRTPAAVTQAGYAYCQLRDTQLSVQSRRGHGPRGNGAREFHGHPCLGGLRRTRAPPLPVASIVPLREPSHVGRTPRPKVDRPTRRRYSRRALNAC